MSNSDIENGYNSNSDCGCNCYCGCPVISSDDDKVFNTSSFSDETMSILEMFLKIHHRFPNLCIKNYHKNMYFGGRDDQDFKEHYDVKYNLNLLTHTYPLIQKREWFHKYGFILMNKYTPAKHLKLIIGCGHYPIENNMSDAFWTEYSNEHHHKGCFTIDPDLRVNADLVGVWGEQKFPCLPDGSFFEIRSEGLRAKFTPIFMSETTRLLKEGGCYYCDGEAFPFFIKENGKLLILQDRRLYLGLPDLHEWNRIREEYEEEYEKNECGVSKEKNLPICHHEKEAKQNVKELFDDDEDEMDIVFLTIKYPDEEFALCKSIYSKNNMIGRTKYYICIERKEKSNINFTYIPKNEKFVPSKEFLCCGHFIPIEHHTWRLYNVEITFTSSNKILSYISIQTL
jgi:hypothetical protein